ncbi:MAG: TonB-dependent receptor [Gemmatimonadetes bacterium]|nr:TonB-dependent receptor [Gemmatimonadota bacterium]MCY3943956.1 TonB-dependent receptor [Gemmatimonadota bacterium]
MTSRRPTAHEPATPGRTSGGLRAAALQPRLARAIVAVAASASVLAPASQLAAQSTSTAGIRGRVVDGRGAPVAAAALTLVDTRTGTAATTQSDADGRYAIRGQRPGGPYSLTVSHIGFQGFSREGIVLRLGRFVDLGIVLVTEAIGLPELVVRAEADPDFNPGRIGISTLVTSETLRELPTLSRNFIDFAALSPVARVTQEGVSVAGASFRFNTLSVDGALNQDVFGLSTNNVAGGRAGGRVIPLDAVEQFRLEVAPFDIRQSGFTGGALNAVTKSGTNEFETSGFGYYRGGALVGELVIDDVPTRPELSAAHGGFTVGGPIRRDEAHFFVAGEWEQTRQPPIGYHIGESDPFRLALAADSAERLVSLLESFGAEAGTARSFGLDNRIVNLFARLDWKLAPQHDAMFRYSFAAADDDADPNRLPGDAYELSSNGTSIRSRNHSTVLRLVSSLGNRFSNELSANLQIMTDDETAASDFPQVDVTVYSTVGDHWVTRDVRAGADFFAQENGLKQRIVQLTNNLSRDLAEHQLLAGASGTWFSFDRRFVPGALGSYEFESLEALALNTPNRYEITIPVRDRGAAPEFGVFEASVYGQDEWEAHDRLTLRLGARLDMPFFVGCPEPNPALEEELGIDVVQLPDKRSSYSIRAGFNWRPRDGTQLRAGAGIFTGRPAYSWLANAFQNNGLALATIICRGDEAPPLDPSRPAPSECANGQGDQSPPIINYFDPEFRFPQDLRSLAVLDQRLPGGVVLSISWMENRALRQIHITNENLAEPDTTGGSAALGNTPGFGWDGRHFWGRATFDAGEQLWVGGTVSDIFGPALRVGNHHGDIGFRPTANFAYAATAELRKDFGDAATIRAGYSLTRSADMQDLLSLDVTSNYATTPVNLDPNNPPHQPSRFDRPHKVVASARARILPQRGGTEIGVLYSGQSGAPYSYVYSGDVNGDGFPGPRAANLSNDLIFVPPANTVIPGSIATQILWDGLFEVEECLQEQVTEVTEEGEGGEEDVTFLAGRIMARNACRAPWSNRLDLRIAQTIHAKGIAGELSLDLLNVLNLVNSSWGLVQTTNPVVQLFRAYRAGLTVLPPPGSEEVRDLRILYMGGTRRDPATGRVAAARPLAPEAPSSQWRAQIGLRLRSIR